MTEYLKKRESLELFTREQIIGPGALNKHLFLLNKWDKQEFNGKTLKDEKAILNEHEIITESPAYQYSSGILFPRTKIDRVGPQATYDNTDTPPDDEQPPKAADDESHFDKKDDALLSKQQNYPNTCGLAFALDNSCDIKSDLNISVSFRRYNKLKSDVAIPDELGLWVPEYEVEIKKVIDNHFKGIFITRELDGNTFILKNTQKVFDDKILYDIDYIGINSFVKEAILDQLNASNLDIKELPDSSDQDVKRYGVEIGERTLNLYGVSKKKGFGKKSNDGNYPYVYENVITLYQDSIVSHLIKVLEQDISNYASLKGVIQNIEVLNQVKHYLTELKTIFKEGKSQANLWEAVPHTVDIDVVDVDLKGGIFRSELKSIVGFDELKYSYQVIPSEKEDDVAYVKILILNEAIVEIKANEPPQLNKKDKANEKSFFGVRLKVKEKKENTLKQYNPPNLLEIDEEDSFNKLLYRSYKDFGEGYNTSVEWGHWNGSLRYVSTEFLPKQTTPKVDFIPGKIVDGKVENWLGDEIILQMRALSTFSDITDEDIINRLHSFIDNYKKWIDIKRVALSDESQLKENEIGLLKKQLAACEVDFKRLKRNIELLKNDNTAMAAFRVMNSAMFMQLHHSIKTEKGIFLPEENTEDFYKNVPLEKEYQWRAFQLAFILLNIDAFVYPEDGPKVVEDVFKTGWPERNEIADMIWFPTGGGKTEAYLGIIAFYICYRRFTKKYEGFGTAVFMRYTLRLLTLQQFQRATKLICALEVIRKECFTIPNHSKNKLGDERIYIGLFVGSKSLPNKWTGQDDSMVAELDKIKEALNEGKKIETNLPFTECPWCGTPIFRDANLTNIHPNQAIGYGINERFKIACNSSGCAFNNIIPTADECLPLSLFDEDIYKFPPTLLFGTVDKFAALANKVSTEAGGRNDDTSRLLGKGYQHDVIPPELIIQDELHLLLGPLGSAVGLFEKAIDMLCTHEQDINGTIIKTRPKIITSTATTRNTDKQVFALFNRRSEVFPKQGISCDDSFFAFYERNKQNVNEYESNRKYLGLLPIGKTQVWMQLRIASIAFAHRIKHIKESFTTEEVLTAVPAWDDLKDVFDYYHTVLMYFNSLKEVGKTQSQLSHYLPGDIKLVVQNTIPWSFVNTLVMDDDEINDSELTGRLTGQEVKTNLSSIQKKWDILNVNEGERTLKQKEDKPPEFVIATNMISVGIDVSRFNTMIISSMPRNIAEYIQASSRVARQKEGLVFTVHHPFRSRDISHYQKFKEFHEKFYSYVEPISVTPFASKALRRYFAMFLAAVIRHTELKLMNNNQIQLNTQLIQNIKKKVVSELQAVLQNAEQLDNYLSKRTIGVCTTIDGIISDEEFNEIIDNYDNLMNKWLTRIAKNDGLNSYRNNNNPSASLFTSLTNEALADHWKVGYSLREIDPSTVIKTVQQ